MVRDTKTLDELIESIRSTAVPPERIRAQRRSLVYGNTAIENPHTTRDIAARADADFELIFGSE